MTKPSLIEPMPWLKESIFPELTPAQADMALLYALGVSTEAMGKLKGITPSWRKRCLTEIRDVMELPDVPTLRTVALVRIMTQLINNK